MLAVAVAGSHNQPPESTFRITFGLKDRVPAEWSGEVSISGGELIDLSGWRFEEKDHVRDRAGWYCRTRNYVAPELRYAIATPGLPPRATPVQPWPNGVTLRLRGNEPELKIALTQGVIHFSASKVRLGEPQSFLAGQVQVERLPSTSVVRPPAPTDTQHAVHDDFPAFWVRYKTRKHYLAWVAYQNGHDRILLSERDGPDGDWSKPLEVDGSGDHFRVALAGTHGDTVWIVWSSQRDHKWNLYARAYQNGVLGNEVRLTDSPGPDIWHRMTTDGRGRAWLVWQGFRHGRSQILARCADADGWHDIVQVASNIGNNWDPTVEADAHEDRIWIGWDSYERGNYGVRIRSLSGGPTPVLGSTLIPEESPLFGAHVSLACDRDGRLWAAWDESGPQWGKDYGFVDFVHGYYPATRLYASRRIRLKCLVDGKWLEPAADFQAVLPADLQEYNELPQLQVDSDNRLWMAFRHRTCRYPREDGWAMQGRWDLFATAYLGDRWLPIIDLPQSGGRNDMRTSSQRDSEGNIYFAYASDNRG
jgi:hypothetical protein